MAKLLVVEDDPAISNPLVRALEREGFEVEHVDQGEVAVERALSATADLILLDLTLPDIDGLEVCRRIRDGMPHLPIVMLTARSEEVQLVVGLDAGADDYVTKPFRVAELVARVRTHLRAASPTEPAPVGRIRVDVDAHRVWIDEHELDLSPKEFDLLALLVSEAEKTVARDRIMRAVWDPNWYGPTRTLDVHVSSLRKKLGDLSGDVIATVRGVGFRYQPNGPD